MAKLIRKDPNNYDSKYGEHVYSNSEGPIDCSYGCGCWKSPNSSGGPLGLDPSKTGKCPKNPKSGKSLGGTADYEYVVKERIDNLTSRAEKAEARLDEISPTKLKLVNDLVSANQALAKKNQLINELRCLIGPAPIASN